MSNTKNKSHEAKAFYDSFGPKLLNDYLHGNSRMIHALNHAINFIPPHAKAILDIGCGLGWSSHEFAKAFPQAQINGVDLSSELIKYANKLFERRNLTYSTQDVTSTEFRLNAKYDAIVMLDVYEHIPEAARNEFNLVLKDLLTEEGVLILTCPSHYHQEYLRENKPEGLQPVDEDITLEVLTDTSATLGKVVSFFKYTSIWNPWDYIHVVISNNPGSIFLVNKAKIEHKWLRRLRYIRKRNRLT